MCEPLVPQALEYQPLETFTGSLKLMVMFASRATPVAPFAGSVLATAGAFSTEQRNAGVALLRGLGAPAEKSAALLSVSAQPFSARRAAVVFVRAGAGPLPSKQFGVVTVGP